MSGRLLRVSERIYRALLVLYPKEFRDTYGPHMAQVFRDDCREAVERTGTIGFVAWWTRTMLDLLSTALAERGNASTPVGSRLEQVERFLGFREPKWRWNGIFLILIGGPQVILWSYLLAIGLDNETGRHGVFSLDAAVYALAAMHLGQVCQGAGELLYGRRRTLAVVLRMMFVFFSFPLAGVFLALYGYSKYGAIGALLGMSTMLVLGLVCLVVARLRSHFTRGSDAR